MQALELTADRAVGWSVAADRKKALQSKARWTVFGLSIAGALFAALASQFPEDMPGSYRRAIVAALAAGLLAFATLITSRFLGQEKTRGWVLARATSEALKREAFRFAAQAAPYDGADASKRLTEERTKIEAAAEKAGAPADDPGRKGSSPRVLLSPEDYLQKRVVSQATDYYRKNAAKYAKTSKLLRRGELVLSAAATLITVYAGAFGKTFVATGGITFDWAALTAVLTTVTGLILAHIESSRLDHLVDTYLATARRLEDRTLEFDEAKADPSIWSAFVNRCEDIIAAENTSWVAKWAEDKP